jgi:hypothetical protein
MQRMKTQRVACLTYHKYPGDDWAEDEFQARPVKLANGQVVEIPLCQDRCRLPQGECVNL